MHRLPTPVQPEDESVGARFTRLLRLEFELGMAETRSLVRTLVLAVAVGVPAAIALVAGLVVALIAAVAPFFDVRWEPFLIAGGGIVLLALLALAWSAWRVKSLSWPTETLRSFEENWRWLAAQLRSRLTLR